MGQVIQLDFAQRKAHPVRATRTAVQSLSVSETPLCASTLGRSVDSGLGARPGTRTIGTAVPQPLVAGMPRTGTGLGSGLGSGASSKCLVAACAEMRAHTTALSAAVEELRHASVGLSDLPRLARELCRAAL